MLDAVLVRAVLCSLFVSAAPARLIAGEFVPALSPSGEVPRSGIAGNDAARPVLGSPVLEEIADWVSQNFAIPASASLPGIEIVSPERFSTVMYRRLVESRQTGAISELRDRPPSNQLSDVVAFYENASRTVFLRQGWTSSSAADVSVLVHEFVHHLQNVAGMTYACPAEREKLAYAAQQKWLERSGHDFFEAFETDRMTLLVRTSCAY